MADKRRLMRDVSQVGREISTIFDGHLRQHGLTLARARILLQLIKTDCATSQSAVTEHLQVEHPTAVRILDGLEALGYIVRTPAPSDRRAKNVELTETGRPLAERVVATIDELNAVLLEGVDPADAEIASSVLETLLTNLATLKADTPVAADPK